MKYSDPFKILTPKEKMLSRLFCKNTAQHFFIGETKGHKDTDDPLKIKRLTTGCKDINEVQGNYTYTPVYIKQEKWEEVKNDLKSFNDLLKIFSAGQNEI